jgi:predicted MPP superfamily phosphohydrolase
MRPPQPQALPHRPHRSPAGLTWQRLTFFVGVVGVILLAVNAFVCATLAHFLDLPRPGAWQAGSGILTLGFIAATIVGRFTAGWILRMVYSVTAVWLGLLNYAFFAALACWVADGAALLAGWPATGVFLAGTCFGGAILAAVCGIANAAWLRTTHVTVALPRLPEAWTHRRIALISDLHLGHIQGPFFLRRVLSRLRHLQPDLVLVSGDMFDGTTQGIERLVQAWSGFSVPLGIHFVTGNHDEFADQQQYLEALAQVGVRALNNERMVIDGLQIVGVHDGQANDPEGLRALLRRMPIDRNAPAILLAHKPENLRIAEEEGISLQLSGHTHLGQLWPWNLLVRRIYGNFAYGLQRLDRLQVYTSSGVGTWGPPLRVGTRSEIVLLRLAYTEP